MDNLNKSDKIMKTKKLNEKFKSKDAYKSAHHKDNKHIWNIVVGSFC